MITYRELVTAFRDLELSNNRPVIFHAAMSSFGDEVRGGAESVLGALISATGRVLAPTFTYKTMVIPETGPENNAASYGSGAEQNLMAEFFTPEMPADKSMGVLAESLRLHPSALRSVHPILSFAGIGVDQVMETQTFEEPLAPLRLLAEMGGDVLLIGVDQRVNTSIHYGERLAGRKQFVRWALTPRGVVACPGFPGCSDGFNQLAPYLAEFTRRTHLGMADLQAIALEPLLKTVVDVLHEHPSALLCERESCERCAAVREALSSTNSLEPG